MASTEDLFWLMSRETTVGRGDDVFVRSSHNESGPYKCNGSWGKRNTFSRLLPDGGRTGNADLAAMQAHAVLALSLPSTLCAHQQYFGRWCPALGWEPKRESGVTSGDSCLLDTSAAESSSQTASVMLKREKRIGDVGEKRKSERTEAVSCERTIVMHLVMVPRKNCP